VRSHTRTVRRRDRRRCVARLLPLEQVRVTRRCALLMLCVRSVAVGAHYAVTARGYARVAIVDFDIHHGNGAISCRCVSVCGV
jgi:hypothetical protein